MINFHFEHIIVVRDCIVKLYQQCHNDAVIVGYLRLVILTIHNLLFNMYIIVIFVIIDDIVIVLIIIIFLNVILVFLGFF